MPVRKICCIGADHIGGSFGSVVAFKCPDIEVKVVDENEERIMQWNSSKLPVFEDNLTEIVQNCRGKNLFFTTEMVQAIKEADVIFICVNLELKTQGLGSGKVVDLKPLEDAAHLIANTANASTIIVEKSTVPVRAAETVAKILNANHDTGRNFIVLSNPEFLTEGSAVNDLLFPETVLIGGDKTPQADAAMEALISIYQHWVPKDNIIKTDMWSSQLTKLAKNALLAQRISSINSLSEICEVTNADVSEVASAIGMDSRIGPKGLEPSIGFGGPSLYKDILNIVYLCECLNLSQVATYWQNVVDINEYQKKRFTKRIVDSFFTTLTHKEIAILGFSFKKDTGVTSHSPAIYVCKTLLEERAKLNIYDPVVSKVQIIEELKKVCEGKQETLLKSVTIHNDPYEAIAGTHGVVICTDWAQFASLDYYKVYNDMMKPAYLFDGRKMLPHSELIRIGFNVLTVGKNFNPNFSPAIKT